MQQLQNCLLDNNMILQSDGTLYIGSISHSHLDGFSLIINPDGSYYYGLFKESLPFDIGVYKLKNSCLKLQWGDNGTIQKVENIDNQCFLHKVIPFKNNFYGNKILVKLNKFSYGVAKNGKFDGFTVQHYKNGDIYYGSIFKGKQDGEGIHYSSYNQEWHWNNYKYGKLTSQTLYGTNLVPREIISKLFNRIQAKTMQITMVSLQQIQQLIINQLLLNSELQHISLASTSQSAHPVHRVNLSQILIDDEETGKQELIVPQNESFDDQLQVYNQQELKDEIESKLTKCQTEKAISRITKERQNKFQTQPSQSKSLLQRSFPKSPIRLEYSLPRLIMRRSISPAFTTIRPLFSVIRI